MFSISGGIKHPFKHRDCNHMHAVIYKQPCSQHRVYNVTSGHFQSETWLDRRQTYGLGGKYRTKIFQLSSQEFIQGFIGISFYKLLVSSDHHNHQESSSGLQVAKCDHQNVLAKKLHTLDLTCNRQCQSADGQ